MADVITAIGGARDIATEEEILKRTEAYRLKLQEKNAKNLTEKVVDYEEKFRERLRIASRKKEELDELNSRKRIEKEIREINRKYALETGNIVKRFFVGMVDDIGGRLIETLKKTAVNLVKNTYNSLDLGVKSTTDIYSQYYTAFNTRLLNSALSASEIFQITQDRGSANPYYKLTTLLSNTSKFVEAGITEGIVLRAFLETISDKIATTFSALEPNLLKIIRIQQLDTTASRLGLEASLTKLFNEYFGDTSYLSTLFDNIQGILLESSAQLGYKESIAYEYQVQKWLGSLGAIGVSENTLSQIALGLNYLGTGNINALSGNTALQNLMVLAAQRGGVSYTDILSRGMSAYDANAILAGLVNYVRSLGGNNVVRAQYADLFGLTLTDIKVIQSLTEDALKSLSESAMTYGDTIDELNSQLTKVSERMHLSEKIDNVLTNVVTATGMSVAGNAALYSTYKIADMIESITGGIPLFSAMAMGSGVGFEGMTYEKVMKAAVMGLGLLGPLGSAFSNLFGEKKALDLKSYATTSTGGTGFRRVGEGLTETLSGAGFVYNENQTGSLQAMYQEQTEQGEEVSGVKTDSSSEIIELIKYLKEYFEYGGSEASPLKVNVTNNELQVFNVNGYGNIV